jgi:hypothetical protein
MGNARNALKLSGPEVRAAPIVEHSGQIPHGSG